MDRTGNLLDSLCWGVSYDGKLVEGGFFREKRANTVSALHEWSTVSFKQKTRDQFGGEWQDNISAGEDVDGRQLAEAYIQRYGNNGAKGWKVFFAILAPYWGYWEKGFMMVHGLPKSSKSRTFRQFAVMTQFYDQVKADLKPMRTRFRVSVATYTSLSLKKQAERYFNS